MRHVVVALVLLAAAGCAAPVTHDDDAMSLAAAERAFAAQSVRTDMRAAFLANFADDGVFVRNGWVNAQASHADRPAPPITLDWWPTHVEVSRAGDLGLSTGPWLRASRNAANAPPAHGHFVSIWRRQPDGAWKVEVDIGISHREADTRREDVESVAPAGAAANGAGLEQAEKRFVETSLREGAVAAYQRDAVSRTLFYRDGSRPMKGAQAALASGAVAGGKILWFSEGRAVAASNDLGYVRGTYADAANPSLVRGYFMRVWRHDADGWRIALDVTNPAN